jgi:hypothetical protein
MKKVILAICLTGLVSGSAYSSDQPAELNQAKQATAAFAGALKAELLAAMKSDGPLHAMDVCNTRAKAIGNEVSIEYGAQLSRVSARNRSPDNVPNEWQSLVLESFEDRKQAGESFDTLSWYETVETESVREFRFMKAIPTGGLCLQCHGKDVIPTVSEKLAELYPEDKATGFGLGDIRGAFVVTLPLN